MTPSPRMRDEIACLFFDDDAPKDHAPKSQNRYESYKGELVAYTCDKPAPELWDKARAAAGLLLAEIEARQSEATEDRRLTSKEKTAERRQRERELNKQSRQRKKLQRLSGESNGGSK